MATVLITGCNRGIGSRNYVRNTAHVATTSLPWFGPSTPIWRPFPSGWISGIDVGDGASMPLLKKPSATSSIDVLLNNAGLSFAVTVFGDLDYAAMEEQFRVNTLGPLRVTEALCRATGQMAQKWRSSVAA